MVSVVDCLATLSYIVVGLGATQMNKHVTALKLGFVHVTLRNDGELSRRKLGKFHRGRWLSKNHGYSVLVKVGTIYRITD